MVDITFIIFYLIMVGLAGLVYWEGNENHLKKAAIALSIQIILVVIEVVLCVQFGVWV